MKKVVTALLSLSFLFSGCASGTHTTPRVTNSGDGTARLAALRRAALAAPVAAIPYNANHTTRNWGAVEVPSDLLNSLPHAQRSALSTDATPRGASQIAFLAATKTPVRATTTKRSAASSRVAKELYQTCIVTIYGWLWPDGSWTFDSMDSECWIYDDGTGGDIGGDGGGGGGGGNDTSSDVAATYIGGCALPDDSDPTNDASTGGADSSARRAQDLAGFCKWLWGTITRSLQPPQVYQVQFRRDHFVAQHLQGVVQASEAAVEAAIVADIQAHAAADNGYPESQLSGGSHEYTIAFNDNGNWINLAYRAYLWQSPSGPVISIGTVFKK